MKIDAFTLDLSSLRTCSETLTIQSRKAFSFVDLMDARLEDRLSGDGRRIDAESGAAKLWDSQWVTPVSVGGAVSLTDQFRVELENLRQIMSAVMAQFQRRMNDTGVCRLTRFGQLYAAPVTASGIGLVQSWQYTQSVRQTYTVSEQVAVSAGGMVKTSDNREINFSLDLSMERAFFREEFVEKTVTGYALIDPLVIQTGARTPMLSGGTFAFDLDLDGETEDLPLPGAGYGFLSLDLNQDGQINDGSELFGPSTGSGFGELAAYDLDQNLWIDENDEIFDQLTLWEQGDAGMTLTRIKDAGIGAIYLAAVASPFDLTNGENELMGRVAATSLALTEDGGVLPVQEVDYTV